MATLPAMDAKTARTLNMRAWVAAENGPTAFAAKFGGDRWSAAQVSQWISASNPKPIGHKLARALETVGGLPSGALDSPPESFGNASRELRPPAQPLRLDPSTVADSIAILRHELRSAGLKFDPHGEIALFVVAYEYLADASLENMAAFEQAVAEHIRRTKTGEKHGPQEAAAG